MKQSFFSKKDYLINFMNRLKFTENTLYIMFSCIVSCMLFNSCLESGLDDLPNYSDAEMTEFKFEYRWFDEKANQLRVIQLNNLYEINKKEAIVTCNITIPNAEGTFTNEIRSQVRLNNLVGYCSISPGATISPVENSPDLGVVADFSSKNVKYRVTAADGTVKVWTVCIGEFKK